LLAPRSLALIGATESSSWSQALLGNLQLFGFDGRLHLVHPRHSSQFGRPCHPSLADVPDEVDAAYVMTGTALAEQVLTDCARKGVRSVVMLTAGFREVGGEGVERERRIVDLAREHGITMLGPNCLGFINYTARTPAYALTLNAPLPPGRVAIASQSGATLMHLHRLAYARGAGLARMVSIGNEAMCTSADLLDAWLEDPDVAVLGVMLEGFRDPVHFLAVARRALDAGKPLVVLKAGRSPVVQRAASAHTGSLAGEDRVADAVLRQVGAVRVGSLEELLETCVVLDRHGWPEGRRTAVITTSGGSCSLVSDLTADTVLDLADFAPETKQRLGELLPDFGTPQNPLDTTGVIVNQPGLLADCVDAVVAENSYDAFLVNTDPPRTEGLTPGLTEQRLNALVGALERVPVFWTLASTAAVDLTDYGREAMLRHGLYCSNGLPLGVAAVDGAIRYGLARQRRRPVPQHAARPVDVPGGTLDEVRSRELLASGGIESVPARQVREAAAAGEAADALGYPCVVKIVSAEVTHKSDAGGVRLGLQTRADVEAAAAELLGRHGSVLVARQVAPVAELLAGVTLDAVFGPVVVVGLGGIFTEVLDDVAMRLPPLDEAEALEMLSELRGAAVLNGARGRPPADAAAIARVLVKLGDLALDLGGRLRAIDVNPLFALPEGALAGDALVELA
jgi:acetate---CoA ligase (ADP-forming)